MAAGSWRVVLDAPRPRQGASRRNRPRTLVLRRSELVHPSSGRGKFAVLVQWRESPMADQRSRGGKKQGPKREPQGKKHQGVRPGTTARAKERSNRQRRKPTVPRAKA